MPTRRDVLAGASAALLTAKSQATAFRGNPVTPVDQFWSGALTDTSFAAQYDLATDLPSNIVVALASDTQFSSPVFRSTRVAATKTANATGGFFYTTIPAATGLSPNTAYRYGLEIEGFPIGGIGTLKTAPTQGTAAAFSFLFGSCSNFSNGTGAPQGPGTCQSLENMATESGCLFTLHNGDLNYTDYTGGVLTFERSNNRFTRAFRSSASAVQLLRGMPTIYTWSDHDSTTNDSTISSGSWYTPQIQCATTVYQETVPSYPLGNTATLGIAQSWWIGSCFFIMPDCYAFRDTAGSPPPMLGTTQYNWVVSQITAAVGSGATLIFLVSSPTWTNSSLLGWNPTWAVEQTALLDAIKAIPGVPGVCVLEGDNHKSGADDGTYTDFSTGGGMKIIRLLSSPLKQTACLTEGQPCSWNGVVNTNTTSTRVYCRVDVNSLNTGLTATFKGLNSGNGPFSVVGGPFDTAVLPGW